MSRRLLLSILSVALLAVDISAQGCAMCGAVAKDSGFNTNAGILWIMPVPYILIFLLFRKRIVSFFKEFANAQG